jgi:hypothetical protein
VSANNKEAADDQLAASSLDPIGFERTKRGDRRIIRAGDGRHVSSCPKLGRRDLEYIRWYDAERRNDAAG